MTDKLNPTPQPELSETDAELLSAYLDDMLADDERRALEARLRENAFLRRELSAMRQTVAWINALPTLKAPRDFTITEADVRPVASDSPPQLIPFPRQSWYLAAAAFVVVLIGIVAVLPAINNRLLDSPQAEQIALQATVVPTLTTLSDEIVLFDSTSRADEASDQADTFNMESADMPEPPINDSSRSVMSAPSDPQEESVEQDADGISADEALMDSDEASMNTLMIAPTSANESDDEISARTIEASGAGAPEVASVMMDSTPRSLVQAHLNAMRAYIAGLASAPPRPD
ncbi:MAG: anti-sigma factor family protein [Anaerolineae bacterium]